MVVRVAVSQAAPLEKNHHFFSLVWPQLLFVFALAHPLTETVEYPSIHFVTVLFLFLFLACRRHADSDAKVENAG